MINRPTLSEMLRCVSKDLLDAIEPALEDPTLAVKVQQMAALIDAIALRSDEETKWLLKEITAVETVTRTALPSMPDDDPAHAAWSTLQAGGSLDERYQQAGELLSCLAEAAFRYDDAKLQRSVRELLAQRLAHEVAVIGEDFKALGRG